ncbi:MAG TPA: VCBS repeat-containing protein, partial [Phycisphaeraceae bacterium]
MSDARPAAGATKRVWRTEGFEAFRRGTFGNAGHNLYVSRAGVLQRIHQYDINHDGYVDLLFCNSQDHLEIPPAYVYRFTPAGIERAEVPLQGAAGAAVADLNGDGRPEFIVGGWYDGVSWTTNATLYYGSDRGWGEHAVQYLPAPLCLDVAAGDYDGDGRPDLAFQLYASLRIYYQTDLAFEPKRFVDLKVAGSYIDAADLDGDGRDELIVRDRRGRVTIYWGGADGLNVERCSVIDVACDDDTAIPDEPQIGPDGLPLSPEWRENAYPRVQVVKIRGVPHVFAAGKQAAWFVPCRPDRTFGEPWSLPCMQPMAVAVADLEGDGGDDLILAAREQAGDEEVSAVFWDEGGAYEPARRTLLPTLAVTDVTVGDYDGDGRLEIAFAAGHTENAFDCRSRIYRVNQRQPQLAFEVDVMDAQRVFSVREEGRDALVVLNQQGRSKLGNIDVSIYLGGADGFRPDRRIDVPAWGATVAVCADFNDDGRVDLAIANTAENSIDRDPGSYVYFQREDGFRSQPDLVLPTRRSHGIACADLNRDGYLDLVFAGF